MFTTEITAAGATIAAEFLILGERFERKSVRHEVLANHGRILVSTDDGLVAEVELIVCSVYPEGRVVTWEALRVPADLAVLVDERRIIVRR